MKTKIVQILFIVLSTVLAAACQDMWPSFGGAKPPFLLALALHWAFIQPAVDKDDRRAELPPFYTARWIPAVLFAGAFENMEHLHNEGDPEMKHNLFYNIYGTLDECRGSESDLLAQVVKRKEETDKVRLFQCCGTRDTLYPANLEMRDALRANGWDVTYSEGDAAHDFAYWDLEMPAFFDWLDETREREV